jgi:XTP/dITP diphosphohydrolase
MKKDSRLAAFKELLDIMDELREKCPWDRKQTFESLRKLTIEETYELADAILKNKPAEIKDELGDLMLHIVFYAKLGDENGTFNMTDILNSINEKLVTRHPHVFGDTKVADEEDVIENWEKIKLRNGKESVLGGIPKSLPALIKANRLQEKVHGVGFENCLNYRRKRSKSTEVKKNWRKR